MDQTEVLAIQVNISLMDKVIKDMKTGKIPGPSGIPTDMFKIYGNVGYLVTCIINKVVCEELICNNWCSSIIVNHYKGIVIKPLNCWTRKGHSSIN